MQDFLDTRQLRAFAALARCGSFTEAAGELCLTQSAVSHSMKALEEDLGSRLFLRSGKRVLLTQAGKELLVHAEAILRRMVHARDAISALEQSPRGRLRIGCGTSAAQHLVMAALREFRECFPLYQVIIVPGETPATVQRLRDGEIDLGISLKPHEPAGLICELLFTDQLELLVGPHHRWLKVRPKPSELAEEALIVSSRKSQSSELLANHLLLLGVRPGNFIEMDSLEVMKQFVRQGLGTAVTARWTAQKEIGLGELVCIPLPKGPLVREWVVSHLEDRPLNLAEQTFAGLCAEVGKSLASV